MVKHVNGKEVADQTPVSVPAGWSRPVPLQVQIQQMIRREVSRAAASEELETFEEADDFEVEDEEPDPLSPYEIPEGLPERRVAPESLDGDTKEPPAPENAPEAPKTAPESKSANQDTPPTTKP